MQSDNGVGFSLSTSVFPVYTNSTNSPYSSSSKSCSYKNRPKGTKPGNLLTRKALWEVEESTFTYAIQQAQA